MKIAIISAFYPYRGGIAQFGAYLYRQLEKKNEVLAITFHRQFPKILFPGKTQFVNNSDTADPIPSLRILDSLNPFTYNKTARSIIKYQADMVIINFWMPFFAPSLGRIARLLQKKGIIVISILHNLIPHEKRPFDLALIRYFLKNVHGFIVMSNVVKEDLLSMIPDAKFRIHAHPTYNDFRSTSKTKLNLPKNKKIILFFGFIRAYKGLDILLNAMSYMPEEYHLVIAGESYDDFNKYQKLIEKNKLKNKVSKFIRYIDDNEIHLFFNMANVCVLPYKSATQSGIIQLAYKYNLPVISTNVGGLSEMVADQITGLLVPGNNPKKLAEKIEYYFKNDLQTKFSQNIKEKYTKNSWPVFADSIINIYKELKKEKL